MENYIFQGYCVSGFALKNFKLCDGWVPENKLVNFGQMVFTFEGSDWSSHPESYDVLEKHVLNYWKNHMKFNATEIQRLSGNYNILQNIYTTC